MKRVFPLIVITFAVLSAPDAFAEKSLKKKVFDDCPGVLTEVNALSTAEQQEFVEYLGLVLKIPSRSASVALADLRIPTAPAVGSGMPGTPSIPQVGTDGLAALNTSRMLDPEKELEAKTCAVKVLLHLSPASFAAVPEMYEVTGDALLPGDLRDAIVSGAWKITIQSAGDKTYTPPPAVFDELIALSSGDPALFSENALVEHHRTSAAYLVQELREPGAERRERITRVLRQMDSGSGEIALMLLPLLQSVDDTLRVSVLETLGKFEQLPPEALPVALSLLNDSSHGVRAAAGKFLKEYEARGGLDRERQLDFATAEALVATVPYLSPETLPLVEKVFRMPIEKGELLPAKLQPFLASEDPKLRSRALGISGALGVRNDAAFSAVVSALYDPEPIVRLKAIAVLGRQKERTGAVFTSYSKLLKSIASEGDPRIREEVIFEIARAVITLSADREGGSLVPYFIEALAFRTTPTAAADTVEGAVQEPIDTPVTVALIALRDESRGPVTKALRSTDPLVRARGARILGSYKPVDVRNMKELVALLSDRVPMVREQAQQGLTAAGRAAIPELERALDSKDEGIQKAAARLLVIVGAVNDRAGKLFVDTLATEPCARRAALADPVAKVDPKLRNAIVARLIECLREPSVVRNEVVHALAKLGPLPPEAAEQVLHFVETPESNSRTAVEIVNHVDLSAVPNDKLEGLLLNLFKSGDSSLRLEVLRRLGEHPTLSEGALKRLKELADNSGEEPLVRGRAAAVIAKHRGDLGEYREFFIGELKSERWSWALDAISLLTPPLAVELLSDAFRRLPDKQKYVAARGLAALDPKSLTVTPELLASLLSGLGGTEPELRYESLVALIHLDPHNAALEGALRMGLVGKYANRLATGAMYKVLPQIFDSMITTPDSFVQLQAARRAKRLAG